MITLHKFEGKTESDAINKCLAELSVEREDIYLKESKEEAKFLKSKKYILEVVKKEEVIDFIKEYIKELSDKMQIELNCEVRETNDTINVLLVSDKNAIIIGKDGRNLNSIQILLRQAINIACPFNIKIMVDASNYKSKKQKNLEFDIKRICREVLKTKVEAKLDPMNSFERRLVHTIVGEYPDLESASEGEVPLRYTVIKYKS